MKRVKETFGFLFSDGGWKDFVGAILVMASVAFVYILCSCVV